MLWRRNIHFVYLLMNIHLSPFSVVYSLILRYQKIISARPTTLDRASFQGHCVCLFVYRPRLNGLRYLNKRLNIFHTER